MSRALVLLDFTNVIVDRFSSDPDVADRAGELLTLARRAGVPVFHVVPAPMVNDIHPAVRPADGEPVLAKTSIGAFGSTDLQARLETLGVDELLVAGVATGGTVLSTTRWAYDIGYRVVVCAGACADTDPGAHAALVDEQVFPQSWLGLWRIAKIQATSDIEVLHSGR